MPRKTRRPNGEGHIRPRADGRYERQLTVVVQGLRKRVSAYGRTIRELNENTEALRRRLGTGWMPGTANVSVAELGQRLLASVLAGARAGKRSVRTYGQYEWLLREYIVPEIGGLTIGRVTDRRCADVIERARAADKSEQTCAHIYTVLHRAFQFAIDNKWLSVHPMAQMEKPSPRKYHAYVLSKDEARRFIAAAADEPYVGTALVVCLALGMRLGEVLGVRRRAVNERRGKLEISAQVQRLPRDLRPLGAPDGLVVIERPKADSGREPDLPAFALALLRAHIARQAERRLAAGPVWRQTITVMTDGRYGDFRQELNDLLFTTDEGAPLDPKLVRDAFIRVCDAAGIPWSAEGREGLRIHDLRHSAATLLIEAGATAREVMAMCGWSSPQMFLHYTDVQEQARAQTAARMESILVAS
jgi:integrase